MINYDINNLLSISMDNRSETKAGVAELKENVDAKLKLNGNLKAKLLLQFCLIYYRPCAW